MEAPPTAVRKGKNVVIFSDGTGQRGGVYFDEARTNIYKLYRAARSGPDSVISPQVQVAFYDPGLGTQPAEAGTLTSIWRRLYNYVSQATGLGITRNIIDCYAAIIQLWQPGDRIFLFGFSRGAYTVRCLATALAYCGIPTEGPGGVPLKLDDASTRKIAARAVKGVYQHVSSPKDQQFTEQRKALAEQFRDTYRCTDDEGAYPHFIGVFDTVAALSNTGSLLILAGCYVVLLLAASFTLAAFSETVGYWASWITFDAFCLAFAAYIYTHLKFSFTLDKFRWWETIHLTSFRQRFYDQELNEHVKFARHAISIDERRSDFKRVRWGDPASSADEGSIARFCQIWFAGNHADIGGGYPENESRLSDISLEWMLAAAKNQDLQVDPSVLHLNPAADGMQHDETRSLVFALAGKSDRAPVPDATLHSSVATRFNLQGVRQYDVIAPYRPEGLRGHGNFPGAYDRIPLPRQTCWQRLRAAMKAWRKPQRKQALAHWIRIEDPMERSVSCAALAILIAGILAFALIAGYQIVFWLVNGVWVPLPLSGLINAQWILPTWIGWQRIFTSILRLPVSIVALLGGFLVFWCGGTLSSFLYRRAAKAQARPVTPAQTHA